MAALYEEARIRLGLFTRSEWLPHDVRRPIPGEQVRHCHTLKQRKRIRGYCDEGCERDSA